VPGPLVATPAPTPAAGRPRPKTTHSPRRPRPAQPPGGPDPTSPPGRRSASTAGAPTTRGAWPRSSAPGSPPIPTPSFAKRCVPPPTPEQLVEWLNSPSTEVRDDAVRHTALPESAIRELWARN